MSSIFGKKIKVSLFGQSHSEAIGVVIDGLPAGIYINRDKISRMMERRKGGRSQFATSRTEKDVPDIISGIFNDATCGAPMCAMFNNEDTIPSDYEQIKNTPRPGHGDLTAHIKYGGFNDFRGGGHLSGRLTAPLTFAGALVMQILEEKGIYIEAEPVFIGGVDFKKDIDKVEEILLSARNDGDSLGGIVECRIKGVEAGVGSPIFQGVESVIASAIFSVPGVKGIEFGSGFQGTSMKGSENNDEFYMENGKVKSRTNNAGGILGGITSGEDIVFRVAIKPTPSISKEQESVNLSAMENESISVKGRHDTCIVFRAVPVIEAVAALAVANLDGLTLKRE